MLWRTLLLDDNMTTSAIYLERREDCDVPGGQLPSSSNVLCSNGRTSIVPFTFRAKRTHLKLITVKKLRTGKNTIEGLKPGSIGGGMRLGSWLGPVVSNMSASP